MLTAVVLIHMKDEMEWILLQRATLEFCFLLSPSTQVLAILLILRERHLGLKSSGIQFVFWMVLLIYEVIRLRSMSLIHQDDLVLVGWGRAG